MEQGSKFFGSHKPCTYFHEIISWLGHKICQNFFEFIVPINHYFQPAMPLHAAFVSAWQAITMDLFNLVEEYSCCHC
jgi:hypothetical protein